MNQCIGFLELNSIAKGVEAADSILKTAETRLLFARAGCPGKYYILFSGEVATVTSSLEAGKAIGQAHVVGTEKSVRDAIQGGYTELSPLPDDVLAEMREIAVTQTWEELASKSERMARGIEIIKQQNRDYGRQVDY